MLRRIATKWVLTVLAAVLLPFLGFAWYVNGVMRARQWDTVRYYLLTMASELGEKLDDEVRERQLDIELWTTTTPLTEWAVGDYGGEQAGFASMLTGAFNGFVAQSKVYDVILAANEKGELVVSSEVGSDGAPLAPGVLEALKRRDFASESWFQAAMRGEIARVDHHRSDLLPPRNTNPGPHPENFHLGFAVPIKSRLDPGRVVGVVYALMNWRHVQSRILKPARPSVPGLEVPDLYQSAYAWLWTADADTIIGHPSRDMYLKRLSVPPVDLPQLTAAARSADFGLYPEYTFRGVRRNAAFKHCAGPSKGGFGWVVGVGIDNTDVTATVDELQDLLTKATALVLLVVVLGTIVIARRTTRPILELKAHTSRVASGDLDARVEVRSNDELGDLGRAFNQMTSELKDSRAKLVKAEKDAAWREMARQVAHEIKNPLTPIALSATLLQRAKKEGSREFDSIFERTMDLIHRQVENMRKIAADFSAFAGARKPTPVVLDLGELVGEVLDLNAAWAQEARVTIERSLPKARVFVDKHELRRVLINLVSNALEAMPDGGALHVRIAREAGQVVLEVEDGGVGLSETARKKLFEPYFTTRTHGTGLGLAIAKRLVEEMNGTIDVRPRADGAQGTLARVALPEHVA